MPMNKIFVCCSASNGIDPKYLELASDLGKYIDSKGYTLIYGGDAGGEMDVISSVVTNKIAVVPKQLDIKADIYTDTTMSTTYKMIELADLIIVMPGGVGSLMELSTSIHLKRIDELQRKIVILNYEHFFDSLIEHFNKIRDLKFFEDLTDYVTIIDTIEQLDNI